MQRGLIKLSTLAVAMGLASVAQAEVPSFKGGFNVGVEANYMQAYGVDSLYAYNSSTVFGVEDLSNIDMIGATATTINNDSKYKFGFGVNVGYTIPGTGNDINLSYSQIKVTSDSTVTLPGAGANFVLTPTDPTYMAHITANSLSPVDDPFDVHNNEIYNDEGFLGGTVLKAAATKSEIKQRQIDLTLGQTVNVGSNMTVRFNGGVGYTKLNTDQASLYAGNGVYFDDSLEQFVQDENNETVMGLSYSSEFHGVGPTLGVDGTYNFGNTGFGVKAGMQTSLLVGKIKSKSEGFLVTDDSDFDATYADAASYASPSKSHVVPALAANLGLTYDYSLNDNYKLGLEAGYQVKNYFNAVTIVHLEEDNQVNEVTSNLAFAGPYLKLKLAAC